MNLLHIDSSIQGPASASRAISAAIVGRLSSYHPKMAVQYRDLAQDPISHLTLDAFAGEEARAALEQFKRADIVVIGAALYNFGVASQLKSWLDRILVAGETFRYGPDGPEGLAGEKRVIVAVARGGLYGEDSPQASFEHVETYLRGVLAFIGVDEPEFVIAEGLALGAERREASIQEAIDQARALSPTPFEKAA